MGDKLKSHVTSVSSYGGDQEGRSEKKAKNVRGGFFYPQPLSSVVTSPSDVLIWYFTKPGTPGAVQ